MSLGMRGGRMRLRSWWGRCRRLGLGACSSKRRLGREWEMSDVVLEPWYSMTLSGLGREELIPWRARFCNVAGSAGAFRFLFDE